MFQYSTLQVLLDRETHSSYQILVQATDQGDAANRKSATATININILDENDNKPQFSQKIYTVSVREDHNHIRNPGIIKVTATDIDQGDNKAIVYSIFGGNNDNVFKINSTSGQISLKAPLDREQVDQYILNVRAQNLGKTPLSNTTSVIVDVLDVNDNDPDFFNSPYKGSIKEDLGIDELVMPVHARDIDAGLNSQLEYSLINVDPLTFPFYIVPNTGDLMVGKVLDREKQSSYSFQVRVSDKGTPARSVETRVIIDLIDVNDNTPTFDHSLYNVTVREDVSIGHILDVSVKAHDPDAGDYARVTYNITKGNTGDKFQMSTVSGEGLIKVNGPLNYKQVEQYTLTIQATDGGGRFSTTLVKISVVDTNRYQPEFQGIPYELHIDENIAIGTSVYRVFASDNDSGENARVTYELQGSLSFTIEQNTGKIFTRVLLDRELTTGETFIVTARDNGDPAKTATTDVSVVIKDMNDNAPRFLQENGYTDSVMEDAKVNQNVLQISATDADTGNNALVTYTFDGGNDGDGDFKIDSSGVIRVAQELDRETVSVYQLKAFAVDKGYPAQSTSVDITITVGDINDNPPLFNPDVIEIHVNENTRPLTAIAQVSAVDPDEGENAQVGYSMKPGGDSASFELEHRPGGPAIIKNKIDLDYESDKKVYRIEIVARSTPFFSKATLIIKVMDVNDNRPILKDFTIIFNNYVNKFVSGVIGRVPATDPDEMDRDSLTYQLLTGNETQFLYVNNMTGEITLDYRLNSDVPRNSTMQVKVSG